MRPDALCLFDDKEHVCTAGKYKDGRCCNACDDYLECDDCCESVDESYKCNHCKNNL